MKREIYKSIDGNKVIIVSPIDDIGETIGNMNGLKYKYDNLLILGNGFDLNLGLHTTYRDFVESKIFITMYEKRQKEKVVKGNPHPSLIDYLYGKKFCERWFDLEAALLEYVSKRPDGSFVNNKEEDYEDFKLICNSLVEYLSSLFKTGNDSKQAKMMEKTQAGQLLQNLTSNTKIYTFNYTPLYLIINAVFGNVSTNSIWVHGEIKEDTIFNGNQYKNKIILGVEVNDINTIAPGYSFLIKSNNPAYKSSNIASDLLNIRNVVFFGHSLNQMDFGYFAGYFKMLESNMDKERTLTIITKNEESRTNMLDDLRNMGISVRDIYTHTTVEFILIDNLDNKVSEDSISFEYLLNRISVKATE